jgi:hypothetical protein
MNLSRKPKEYYPNQFTPTDLQFGKKGESGFVYWYTVLIRGAIIVADSYKQDGIECEDDDY